MAVMTNRGKRILMSYGLRLQHPAGSGAPLGGPAATNELRVEASPTWPFALWVHFIRQTYFAIGINPDHGTLGDIETASASSVVGRGVHTSLVKWWDGNYINISPGAIPPPGVENNTDDSTTLTFGPISITTNTGPNYAGFVSAPIGGFALCLSNTCVDATEVLAIHEFTSTIAPASASQAITILNAGLVLAES
jgi:hypothetical protein